MLLNIQEAMEAEKNFASLVFSSSMDLKKFPKILRNYKVLFGNSTS